MPKSDQELYAAFIAKAMRPLPAESAEFSAQLYQASRLNKGHRGKIVHAILADLMEAGFSYQDVDRIHFSFNGRPTGERMTMTFSPAPEEVNGHEHKADSIEAFEAFASRLQAAARGPDAIFLKDRKGLYSSMNKISLEERLGKDCASCSLTLSGPREVLVATLNDAILTPAHRIELGGKGR